jgi:hypothetical protein
MLARAASGTDSVFQRAFLVAPIVFFIGSQSGLLNQGAQLQRASGSRLATSFIALKLKGASRLTIEMMSAT